jgi:hypothetical protein
MNDARDDLQNDVANEATMREIEARFRSRMGTLERETSKLRSRVRIMALGLLAAVGTLAAILVRPELVSTGGDGRVAGEIRARSLVLVDSDGLPRGQWTVDEEGNARLALLDERGRQRLSLSVLEGGFPGMSLINAQGQRRAAFGLLPDETTSLVFADAAGVPRAVLGLTRGEAANLVFADAAGVSRIGLALDGTGMGSALLPQDDGGESEGPEDRE